MEPRGRPRFPLAIWLSLALCLLFPPLWNSLLPHPLGEPITVVLTPPHPDDALELPADRIEARRLPSSREQQAPSRSFAFELDRAGRYSIYGISSHVSSSPLVLQIDGARISKRAFDADTGSRHGNFERQRIATGVDLQRGRHRVQLQGPHLSVRTFVLALQREAPLGPLRYLGLAAVAGLLLAVRSWLARTRLSPRARLAAVAVFAVAPPGLALLGVWKVCGPALVSANPSDVGKLERLAELESDLDSVAHRDPGIRYSVAVLGDSTHFFSLDPRNGMRPSLERALRPSERERIDIYGVAARAFSAFDYYLLVNRLVDARPDLVVIPVNARSFGEEWIASAAHEFTPIERYLRIDELRAAPDEPVGRRELGWERVLIRRLDEALAGGRISLLLRGLRRHLRAELLLAAENTFPLHLFHPLPSQPLPIWPIAIAPDHPMLAYFRAINRLAARHGIEVLYYTVQTNLEAVAESGSPPDLQGLYASVEREIAHAPGIHFLDLAGSNPRWMFSDASEHLNERGMRMVSQRIARRISELAAGEDGP